MRILAWIGSAFGALAASACCWLPLLLLAVGSTAAVGATLDVFRVPFAVVAIASLAASFYLAYRTPAGRCPRCGGEGKPVSTKTVQALAKAPGGDYRLCPGAACDVVYFGAATILKRDLSVRFKETESPRPLCYCFGYTFENVDDAAERDIRAKIKAGLCSCETKNPTGRCCLGDVTRALRGTAPVGHADC